MDWDNLLRLAFDSVVLLLGVLIQKNTRLTEKGLGEARIFKDEYLNNSDRNYECIHHTKAMVTEILEILKEEQEDED